MLRGNEPGAPALQGKQPPCGALLMREPVASGSQGSKESVVDFAVNMACARGVGTASRRALHPRPRGNQRSRSGLPACSPAQFVAQGHASGYVPGADARSRGSPIGTWRDTGSSTTPARRPFPRCRAANAAIRSTRPSRGDSRPASCWRRAGIAIREVRGIDPTDEPSVRRQPLTRRMSVTPRHCARPPRGTGRER